MSKKIEKKFIKMEKIMYDIDNNIAVLTESIKELSINNAEIELLKKEYESYNKK